MEIIFLIIALFTSNPFPMTPTEQKAQDCWNTYWKEVAAANKRYSDNPRDPLREVVKQNAMKQAKQNRHECMISKGLRSDYPEPRPRPRLFSEEIDEKIEE
jgi:hypothetical protein